MFTYFLFFFTPDAITSEDFNSKEKQALGKRGNFECR